MSVDSSVAEKALGPGAELWVLENDPKNPWWNEIDFRSGFLLSHCIYHIKKPVPPQLSHLMSATELKSYTFAEDENMLLLGTSHHFHNNWIFLWKNDPSAAVKRLKEMATSLKIKNLRVFSENKALYHLISTGLTASFEQISYIEGL